jgi:hypothetical protein
VRTRAFFLISALIPLLSVPGLCASAPARTHAVLVHHVRVRHTLRITRIIRVAPADEYFGRLKMSILGIRNQLHDLDMRLQYTPDKSADILGSAAYVEDALKDWEHKYPGDPWLAKSVFQLTQLYSQVHTDDGQRCATRTLHWLLGRYGRSRYAAQARTEIASQVK